MASSEDTEITLGTGKLLALFFGLVATCALFFALGYSLGRKSEPAISTAGAAPVQASSNGNKASGGSASSANPAMTFYKAVEQKDATSELTPAESKTDSVALAGNAPPGATPESASPSASADPATTLPATGYFVQVAAVSKQEDAESLVDALKKKEYPAFVAAQTTADKLYRVQLGPFSEAKDAEAIRTKLVGDGYSPILKK